MVVLITAGGTSEPIDTVRSITNTSTGELARQIQKAWCRFQDETGCDLKIHYIAGPKAVLPAGDKQTVIHHVTDTFSVEKKISEILTADKVDIVIHLMAVSDFYVASVRSVEAMAQDLYDKISGLYEKGEKLGLDVLKEYLEEQKTLDRDSGKISSQNELLIHLAKTPKIISKIKKLSPESRLVGFKLLDSVSEEELIQVAKRQGLLYGCDFVVANDLKDITKDRHHAVFVGDSVLRRCYTKEAIALGIVEELMK